MKKLLLIGLLGLVWTNHFAQNTPCGSNPIYRQFDFWLGEWEAFGLNGKKAGDSKISLILDQCVVLEEWTSANAQQGLVYAGKSYNTYNQATKQWQQTWVDNVGGTTEYLQGKYENNKMVFLSNPFRVAKDSMAVRRLSFYPLDKNKVRQHGEISKDQGQTWQTEYDLEYRRKINPKTDEQIIKETYFAMDAYFKANKMAEIADFYLTDAKIIGNGFQVNEKDAIAVYWGQMKDRGISWEHDIATLEVRADRAVQTGTSKLTYKNGNDKVLSHTRYTIIWKKDSTGQWKIALDHYTKF
jgi:ketosteroid isomerase-like protein